MPVRAAVPRLTFLSRARHRVRHMCVGVRAATPGRRWADRQLAAARQTSAIATRNAGPREHREGRIDRLCALNVIDQVRNVCTRRSCRTRGGARSALAVHGWIYEVSDGRCETCGDCSRHRRHRHRVSAGTRIEVEGEALRIGRVFHPGPALVHNGTEERSFPELVVDARASVRVCAQAS